MKIFISVLFLMFVFSLSAMKPEEHPVLIPACDFLDEVQHKKIESSFEREYPELSVTVQAMIPFKNKILLGVLWYGRNGFEYAKGIGLFLCNIHDTGCSLTRCPLYSYCSHSSDDTQGFRNLEIVPCPNAANIHAIIFDYVRDHGSIRFQGVKRLVNLNFDPAAPLFGSIRATFDVDGPERKCEITWDDTIPRLKNL